MKHSILYGTVFFTLNLFFSSGAIAEPQDILSVNAVYATDNNIYTAITTLDTTDHLFISHNAGTSWDEIPLPSKDGQTAKLITKIFAINNNIYIGTAIQNSEQKPFGGGLWISHNSGSSWEYISKQTPNFPCNWINDIYATNNGSNIDLYVATMGGGLAISHNNGKTWSTTSSGWTSNYVRRIYITGSDIYAATTFDPTPNSRSGDIGGVTFSHDGGAHWSTVIPDANEWITSITAFDNKIYATTHGAIANANIHKGGLVIGDFTGTNWANKPVNPDKYGYSYPNLVAHVDSNIFVSTENGGLFVSNNDGDSWNKLIDGNINDLSVANKNIFAATYNSIIQCSYDSTVESKWNCRSIKQWPGNKANN